MNRKQRRDYERATGVRLAQGQQPRQRVRLPSVGEDIGFSIALQASSFAATVADAASAAAELGAAFKAIELPNDSILQGIEV